MVPFLHIYYTRDGTSDALVIIFSQIQIMRLCGVFLVLRPLNNLILELEIHILYNTTFLGTE